MHAFKTKEGDCKRRSPNTTGKSFNPYPIWPNTSHDDWCGDFERTDKPCSMTHNEKGDIVYKYKEEI